MARNIFHQGTYGLREVTLAIQQGRDEVLSNLSAGFDKTGSALSALGSEVRTFRAEAQKFVPDVERVITQAKKDIIAAVTFKPAPTDVTPNAFAGIRVLSQVQDLVTDKKFNLKQNNDTLEKIRCSESYAQAVALLKESDLITEFQQSFRDFAKGDVREMAARLVEILNLYSALIRHFAQGKAPS
jgi:hypothetical protein